MIKNDGFVSGKEGWSIPMEVDSKHKNIIKDIIELQKDSDLYQEKIATLDKENQDLFSANMKLRQEKETLKKSLETRLAIAIETLKACVTEAPGVTASGELLGIKAICITTLEEIELLGKIR